mmetsp:Transcript_52135/g.97854  ORF Transcript_52135/g.97854 Transcript_52135/m.97854 type:complete len:92 (+) Transcript_52135:603-878(+)
MLQRNDEAFLHDLCEPACSFAEQAESHITQTLDDDHTLCLWILAHLHMLFSSCLVTSVLAALGSFAFNMCTVHALSFNCRCPVHFIFWQTH